MELKRVSDSELIKILLKENSDGLDYHPNFLNDAKINYLLYIIDKIDFETIYKKPTKYFGLDYTHRKEIHDGKQTEIPEHFNLFKDIIEFDQLVIEYFPLGVGHTYIRESNMYSDVVLVPLGSFRYTFRKKKEEFTILVERGSALVISGEGRRLERRVKLRTTDKFNGKKEHREPFYLMTFRKLR